LLNKLSKRRDTSRPTAVQQGVVVQLQLPEKYTPQYITNSRSEIVEVGGRTMVSAQVSQLPKLLQEKLGREVEKKAVQIGEDKTNRASALIAGISEPQRKKRFSAADMDITDLV
jgi:septum formation topological specificity factor MinE